MANWTTLKAAIANVIKTNGNQEITGNLLQNTLNSIVNAVGENATFAGIATSTTNPGVPDGPVFYLAATSGVYVNFDGIEIGTSEVAILKNTSSGWNKVNTNFAHNNTIGQTCGLINMLNRTIYADAIKFIAFVPAEEYKNHTFSIYALSARENKTYDDPTITSFDLWLLDEELVEEAQKEVNVVRIRLGVDTDISKLVYSKVSNSYGTIYAIVDWNALVNYKNAAGKYSYVIWGANFANIKSSNLVHVQKLKANDPRIVNWDKCITLDYLASDYGVDENKIVNQKLTSGLFGMRNGLSFNFQSRYSAELKAMRIVKSAYFSFKSGVTPTDVGIGILGNGGGDGTKFLFGFGNLDGTGSGYGTTSLIPITDITGEVKSFYYESDKYKWYVEIDFAAWLELGNVIWSWSTPCCKLNNIIPEDDAIWNYIANKIYLRNELVVKKYKGETDFISSGAGYISSLTGAVIGEIWRYNAYKCKEGDSIKVDISIVNGTIGSNMCAVYAIYNSEIVFNTNTLLAKGSQWDAEAVDYSNTIKIPSGAKSIVFCFQRLGSISVKTINTTEFILDAVDKSVMHLTNINDNTLSIKAAILDARLILDDESMHNSFWNTGHSFTKNEIEYKSNKKLFGVCQSSKGYLHWYWMFPNGSYIPWNNSFDFNRGSGKIIKDGIEYFVKKVSLDGYAATLHIVIDWNAISISDGIFSGNYLDNSIISAPHDGLIQTLLMNESNNSIQDVTEDGIYARQNGAWAKISPTQFTNMSALNFGVDGDSITAGNQWSYYVTQILGFNTHHNVGVGSATWACKKQTLNDVVYQTQDYDDSNFAGISSGWQSTTDPVEVQKRCNNCAKVHVQKFIAEVTSGTYPEPDIFAFAMGTNDSDKTSADSAIATGTEYPSGDMLFTLPGAMKWCIQKIHETYPNCKIFILLPIQRYTGGNENNLQKIEIMKDIAKAFSVEVIDMYSNCGISSMLENGTGPYLSDGLHPNTTGQKLMGKYAASCIRNYIKF